MLKLLRLSEEFSKYLIAAILVIVPLFPKFPFIRIPGTYVSIRLEDLLLFVLGVLVFVKVARSIRSFLKDEIVSALLLFFGIGLVSVFSGAFLTQTIDVQIGLLHLARRIEYVMPFFAILTLFSKEKISESLDYFIKLLIGVTLVAFIYGIGQRYFRFPIIVTQNEEYSKGIALFWTPGSHINSTFAGHYDLAAFMVLILPVFLTLLVSLKGRISRIFLFLATGAGLWLLVNSVSRIAQVSYLLAVGVAFLLVRKYKALAVVWLISLVFIAFSSDLIARFQRVIEVYADEPVATLAPTPVPVPVFEDRSTSIRFNVEWPRAIRAFKKNPLLGTGYSSITLATDNDYLRLLGEMGILGFLAFWLVFFRLGRVFLGAFPLTQKFSGVKQGFIAGITGGIVGTFLSAFFIDLFEASKFATLFWLLLGCAVVLIRNRNYEQET